MKIVDYLTNEQVDFELIEHRDTYAAQRMAEVLHVPGQTVAKTVLLKADHGFKFFVAVLPATRRIDLEKASTALGNCHLELATEADLAEHCPDCEVGALPPFGSEYGLKTIVDESLADAHVIVFEGNFHHEAIRMNFEDFRRLEQPLVIPFAES